MLLRTQFGNWIFAVGGNPVAARMVGVPVNRVKILLFMNTALAAWLVAMIEVTSARSADVLRGEQREFYAIIAAVIGGVLLTGGYGTVIGAVLGALIYGMVRQGVVFAGIDADWVAAVLGAMLLAAVLVNRFVRERALGAAMTSQAAPGKNGHARERQHARRAEGHAAPGAGERLQILRLRHRPRRRLDGPQGGRGPCPARRQRRGQIDADQDPLRRLPAGQGPLPRRGTRRSISPPRATRWRAGSPRSTRIWR